MQPLYPLRFEPMFRRYIWGGRRLADVLGKPIGSGEDYAESWEVVDHGQDQSVASAGPLAGATLAELIADFRGPLLGSVASGSFPLLFKLLDCNRNLSVQVHPSDDQARQLTPPDLGKTEAWVILDAEPGSRLFAGLRPGCDRSSLERAVEQSTVEDCLHSIQPKAGDCIFIPAGTVHALGAGLLVAEIQQSSDTTYRLFDWNRTGPDGKPRQLHVDESLATIDFDRGPIAPQSPTPVHNKPVERLVECDKFVLDRWTLQRSESIGGDGRFHIVNVVAGQVRLKGDPSDKPLRRGETALLPSDCGAVDIAIDAPVTLLDMYLPE